MKKIYNYINGSHSALSSNELSVEDPSTGEKIGKVVLSSSDDFKLAIESSKKSQIEWANTTPKFLNVVESLRSLCILEIGSLFAR